MDIFPYQNCNFSAFLDSVTSQVGNLFLPVITDAKYVIKFQLSHKPLAYSVCFPG